MTIAEESLKKMKELGNDLIKERERQDTEIKEKLIKVYEYMCERLVPTLNLQLGNGYTLVVGIVEDRENENDKVETDKC